MLPMGHHVLGAFMRVKPGFPELLFRAARMTDQTTASCGHVGQHDPGQQLLGSPVLTMACGGQARQPVIQP